MRLLIDIVKPGSSLDEIEELLENSPVALSRAVALLGASIVGVSPDSIQESESTITLLDSDGAPILEIAALDLTALTDNTVTRILTSDRQIFEASPLTTRDWLPIKLKDLAMMIDFSEHLDSQILLPPKLRTSRIDAAARRAKVPSRVLVAFATIAIVDL